MKKLLFICIIIFFYFTQSFSKVGKGEFEMSDEMVQYFIDYLKNEYAHSFVVSNNGKYAIYGICGAKICGGGPGNSKNLRKLCKKETNQECFIFAQRKNKSKVIRWNNLNYIFPKGDWKYWEYSEWSMEPVSQGYGLAVSSETTDENIRLILKELGFIKD